jgi:hypothetical protein
MNKKVNEKILNASHAYILVVILFRIIYFIFSQVK